MSISICIPFLIDYLHSTSKHIHFFFQRIFWFYWCNIAQVSLNQTKPRKQEHYWPVIKKSHICETLNLLTDVDSITSAMKRQNLIGDFKKNIAVNFLGGGSFKKFGGGVHFFGGGGPKTFFGGVQNFFQRMLSISRNFRLSVRLSVCLSMCLSVHFWGTV